MQKILDPMSGASLYQQQSSVKSAKRGLKIEREEILNQLAAIKRLFS